VRWAPGTRLGYVPQARHQRDLPVTGVDFCASQVSHALPD
jgi:hypothetical protein